MVNDCATARLISLGQVVVAGKSDEITALAELLKMLELSAAMAVRGD